MKSIKKIMVIFIVIIILILVVYLDGISSGSGTGTSVGGNFGVGEFSLGNIGTVYIFLEVFIIAVLIYYVSNKTNNKLVVKKKYEDSLKDIKLMTSIYYSLKELELDGLKLDNWPDNVPIRLGVPSKLFNYIDLQQERIIIDKYLRYKNKDKDSGYFQSNLLSMKPLPENYIFMKYKINNCDSSYVVINKNISSFNIFSDILKYFEIELLSQEYILDQLKDVSKKIRIMHKLDTIKDVLADFNKEKYKYSRDNSYNVENEVIYDNLEAVIKEIIKLVKTIKEDWKLIIDVDDRVDMKEFPLKVQNLDDKGNKLELGKQFGFLILKVTKEIYKNLGIYNSLLSILDKPIIHCSQLTDNEQYEFLWINDENNIYSEVIDTNIFVDKKFLKIYEMAFENDI